MKLFENTQQQHTTQANLEKLKAVALESLRDSSRYVEAYNDTTTALGLLKRLEAQGGSNSPVTQLAFESINDQLGYEEGTRLSVETVGEAIIGFGKRMWDKVIAAWEAVKNWSSGLVDRFKSITTKPPAIEESEEKDVKRYVTDPNIAVVNNGELGDNMQGDNFIPNVIEFINNSTNLNKKPELLKLAKTLTEGLSMKKQLPEYLESLYAIDMKGDGVGDDIIESLKNGNSNFRFPTIMKMFNVSKDTIVDTGNPMKTPSENWVFKESTAENYATELVGVLMTLNATVDTLKSHSEFSSQLGPVINAMSKDVKIIGTVLSYLGVCAMNLRRLRVVLTASLGVTSATTDQT